MAVLFGAATAVLLAAVMVGVLVGRASGTGRLEAEVRAAYAQEHGCPADAVFVQTVGCQVGTAPTEDDLADWLCQSRWTDQGLSRAAAGDVCAGEAGPRAAGPG